MSDFVHLHVHSDYSLLDGAATIDSLVERAVAEGMQHLALTDHGNMFGAVVFHNRCRELGINPIIGSEFYFAGGSRHDRGGVAAGATRQAAASAAATDGRSGANGTKAAPPGSKPPRAFHMGIVARNESGYRNLLHLSSTGYTEGFYYRPRIDDEVLAEHADGLIGFSGCLSAKIPSLLLDDQQREAQQLAGRYQEIFGPGNFYLELQDHGLSQQQRLNPMLVKLSRDLSIPLVASNDVHYTERGDARAQDILICVGTGKRMSDRDRLRFDSSEFYFKTSAEMEQLFAELPEAITGTRELAERCELHIPQPGPQLPDYEVPAGQTQDSYLRQVALEGLQRRYAEVTPEIRQRLDHELDVIIACGYSGYFLIVYDFVKFARGQHIPVGPGRGSGAGSVVAYSLRITDVDPLRFGLLFERFLNTERVSMPDFDIDFCYERRSEVIAYVTRKYGSDRVAQIITFGSLKARAVIRDVARVLEIPYAEADAIAKLIPAGPKSDLSAALAQEAGLREIRDRGGAYADLIENSLKLEGLSRHASTHAAGIVIGRDPLIRSVPLYRDTHTGAVSTQYTGEDVLQGIGLVKMDFLGLKTLTLIQNAARLIREGGGSIELDEIPDEDPATYAILGEGKAACVFQFESSGMRTLLTRAKPRRIQDLMALTSLYRPGPMQFIDRYVDVRTGKQHTSYPLPELREILEETHGVIVYQEQVMKIAQVVAGFSLGQADILRRAMGKKKPKEMEEQRARFLAGAAEKGHSNNVAAGIFEMVAPFAEYGFPKPHAAAYSVLSYQTAYLKAHYPAEFMASNLTNEIDTIDKLAEYIAEARSMGLQVLAPDINLSDGEFNVRGETIVCGLRGIRNVGGAAVAEIVSRRQEVDPYRDLIDFLERVDLKIVNRKVVEALVQVGAFDSSPHNRATLMASLERLLEWVSAEKASKKYGQGSLFDDDDVPRRLTIDEIDDWPMREKLRVEREALGIFFSGHPLDEFSDMIARKSSLRLSEIERHSRPGAKGERKFTVIGVVSEIREIQTRTGRQMAFGSLEDASASIEMVLFSDPFSAARNLLENGAVIAATGSIDRSRGEAKLLVDSVCLPDDAPERVAKALHLRLSNGASEDQLVALRDRMIAAPGKLNLFLHCHRDGREIVVEASPHLTVDGGDLVERLRAVAEVAEAWTE
jgi:DNA polymerase-3 subunit alpha